MEWFASVVEWLLNVSACFVVLACAVCICSWMEESNASILSSCDTCGCLRLCVCELLRESKCSIVDATTEGDPIVFSGSGCVDEGVVLGICKNAVGGRSGVVVVSV